MHNRDLNEVEIYIAREAHAQFIAHITKYYRPRFMEVYVTCPFSIKPAGHSVCTRRGGDIGHPRLVRPHAPTVDRCHETRTHHSRARESTYSNSDPRGSLHHLPSEQRWSAAVSWTLLLQGSCSRTCSVSTGKQSLNKVKV